MAGGFAKASADPEVQAMSEQLEMRVEYVSPEECVKILDEVFNQPEDVVTEFGKYIKF